MDSIHALERSLVANQGWPQGLEGKSISGKQVDYNHILYHLNEVKLPRVRVVVRDMQKITNVRAVGVYL